MKTLALLLVAVALTSCRHVTVNSAKNPSGAEFSASQNSLGSLDSKSSNSFIDSQAQHRAESYEKRGYTPEEARALARAEYVKSGK